MRKLMAVLMVLAMLSPLVLKVQNVQASDSAEAGRVSVYQIWDAGVVVAWENAPGGADNYECYLYIENLETHEGSEIQNYYYYAPNPDVLLMYFAFDFDQGYWSIHGGDDQVLTSACVSWTQQWSTTDVLEENFIWDARPEKPYFLPMVVRRR